MFLLFWLFFGVTFGSLLLPKLGLGVVFDAAKNDAKKGLGESWEFGEMWRGALDNLWSVAVLGHSASWALVLGKGQKGQAGNWSRPALEARWRI